MQFIMSPTMLSLEKDVPVPSILSAQLIVQQRATFKVLLKPVVVVLHNKIALVTVNALVQVQIK